MKTLFVSLILCCLGVQTLSAFKIRAVKNEENWLMTWFEDEFTKNGTVFLRARNRSILGERGRGISIHPSRLTLFEDGALKPTKLISAVDAKNQALVGSASDQKLLGVIVDEVAIDLNVEFWMKDLISAMLQGEKITVRVKSRASGTLRVVTTSASLAGFAECWKAVPKDMIRLELAPMHRTWRSSDGSKKFIGRLFSYDVGSGKVKIQQKADGLFVTVDRENLSKSDHEYLSRVASHDNKRQGVPFTEKNRTWTSKDGKTFVGLLLSYDSDSGKASIQRKADGFFFSIGEDKLSKSDQQYLRNVDLNQKKRLPLKEE